MNWEDAKVGTGWTDLDEQDEKIINFIQKKVLVSWTDCEKEFTMAKDQNKDTFVPRYGWAKGTFVNHWKHVKPFLDKIKDPKTGRNRYKVKAQFNEAADKAVLRSDVDQGQLSRVQIPLERFEKVAELINSKSFLGIMGEAAEKATNGMKVAEKEIDEGDKRPQELGDQTKIVETAEKSVFEGVAKKRKELLAQRKRGGLFSKIKESLKPTDLSEAQIELASLLIPMFFEKNLVEQRKKAEFMQIFKDVKIQIVCTPGETVPLLTDEDIVSIMSIVVPKAIDENKGKIREKPFRLIISFPDKSQ
jgi:hypothetical protein